MEKSVEEKEGNLSLILHFDQEGNIVSSIFYIPLKMYNDKIYNELQKVSNRLLKEKNIEQLQRLQVYYIMLLMK